VRAYNCGVSMVTENVDSAAAPSRCVAERFDSPSSPSDLPRSRILTAVHMSRASSHKTLVSD
jgi:hypothetical protein